MAVQRRPDGTLMPGSVINPNGGQMHSWELRAVRNMTYEEVASLGSLLLKGDFTKLEELALQKKDQPAIVTLIAQVLVKGYKKGDHAALDAILNRIIGKVPDRQINQNTLTIQVPKDVIDMNDRDLLLKAKAEIEEALARLPQQLPP